MNDLRLFSDTELFEELMRRSHARALGTCSFCGEPEDGELCSYPFTHKSRVAFRVEPAEIESYVVVAEWKSTGSFSSEKNLISKLRTLAKRREIGRAIELDKRKTSSASWTCGSAIGAHSLEHYFSSVEGVSVRVIAPKGCEVWAAQ